MCENFIIRGRGYDWIDRITTSFDSGAIEKNGWDAVTHLFLGRYCAQNAFHVPHLASLLII